MAEREAQNAQHYAATLQQFSDELARRDQAQVEAMAQRDTKNAEHLAALFQKYSGELRQRGEVQAERERAQAEREEEMSKQLELARLEKNRQTLETLEGIQTQEELNLKIARLEVCGFKSPSLRDVEFLM
jgi:hypothetical protein